MNLNDSIVGRINSARNLINDPLTFDAARLSKLADLIIGTFVKGNKVAFVGNGGSAAEAMHLAAEFTGRCVIEHSPLPAICLNESQSALTAISNDYGPEHMFSRLTSALLSRDDILIAMSTSGKSKNILNAISAAKENNVHTILWMGNFDVTLSDTDIWKVPSKSTPRIQEVHLVWGHVLAEVVEEAWVISSKQTKQGL